MTENATKLKTLIHDTYATAEKRIVEIAERAQQKLKEGRGKERLEEVIGHLSVKELFEKLKANEVLKHGVSLRKELFADVGLVTHEDVTAIEATLVELKKGLAELRTLVESRTPVTKAEVESLRAEVNALKAAKKAAAKPAKA